MKNPPHILSSSSRFVLASLTVGLTLGIQSANAASYYWDPGLTPVTPSGGAGTWDLSTANWSDGSSDIFWPNFATDYAIFGGSAGTVNIGSPVIANRLIFKTTGYTLSGGSAISLDGTSPQINVAPAVTATISAQLSGGAGLSKTGAGTVLLSGATHDYTGTTTINGGILSLGTTGALPTTSLLTFGNGEFAMASTNVAGRTQTVDALSFNLGRDAITLTADPAQSATFTAASLGTRAVGSTILFRGTNLGTAAPGTAGASNILFTTAPVAVTAITNGANNAFTATGTGTLGTTQAAVLRGVIADTSATGGGSSFATYDPTNGVRALGAAEKLTVADDAAYTAASVGDNVVIDLTAPFSITGKQTNTLQVNNTSGSPQTLTNTGTTLMPTNGLLFTGTNETTLTGGTLTFVNTAGAPSDMLIYSSNTELVTISTILANNPNTTPASLRSYTFGGPGNFLITTNISSGSNGGFYFNGPGNVELRSPAYGPSSAGTVVNGGTVSLGTGFALSATVSRPLAVANGATFDIKNITLGSTSTSGVDSINNINGYGGTVTNSGDAITNLPLSTQNGSNADFPGAVTGNINLILNRQGNGATSGRTQKFTGALTYVGSTSITSASTTSTADPLVAANPTAFMVIGGGGSLPSGTALTLGGKITVNGTDYGVETNGANGNGVLTLGDITGPSPGPVNQTVASLRTGLNPGPVTAILGGATTTSTLTVNGSDSTTFAGKLGGAAANNNNLALVKAGSGTLTLSGSNTYTGTTTITAGTLALGATGAFAGSSAFVLNGGTLDSGAFANTLGSLDLNASSTIVFGIGGTLAFAASNGEDWSVFNLAIGGGNFVSGSSLRFGTDATGLTSGQLSQINIAGYNNVGIDGSGFVTAAAVPEPSVVLLLGLASLVVVTRLRRRAQNS